MTFGAGAGDATAVVSSAATPDGRRIVSSLVRVGAGCAMGAAALLDPAGGPAVQAALDARDRVWVLGHAAPGVSARRPLTLTIAG